MVPGRGRKVFAHLPFGSGKFARLEWLGFVSLANGKTAFWLDHIRLAPAKCCTQSP